MRNIYNKTLYEMGKWILAAALVAAIFIWIYGDSWLVKVPDCFFEIVTGLYCPGCGGTRAMIAFCQGHFIKSFLYHPAVPYAIIVYGFFMVKMFLLKHFGIGKEHPGRILIFIYLGIAVILIQWIVKLVLLLHYGIKSL
ncbi:MAG: DUF2752 domain-containing protein [Lachnospiraceae bacterium]|nr:DUF2752 domain-containing protein [Lachnospiraceae bacterium]